MRILIAVLSMLGPVAANANADAAQWSRFARPSAGEARSIGAYQAGCLSGGDSLSAKEPGLVLMRPQRRRHFGHPTLLRTIRSIAASLGSEGHGSVLVGDLSMPRGGPTLSGHVSHQSGLDADVWFHVLPAGQQLSREARRTMPAPGFVNFASGKPGKRWGPAQVALVRAAAMSPAVERVLVNAVIKRRFCDTVTGDRAWLRKLRPWWGHADHMHIRLRCPAGSSQCKSQAPPPPGEGCDASLEWWFTQAAADALAERRKSKTGRVPPVLPAECRALAAAPDR